MTTYRPAEDTYFTSKTPGHVGERFLIEIDESADRVTAAHVEGHRRTLGLTVKRAKQIAKRNGWREVQR